MKPSKKSTGAILVTVMLMLFIITLLTINILQTSILATKMDSNFQNKMLSLHAAEQNLAKKQQTVLDSPTLPDGVIIISTAICGVTFYRATATAKYHEAETTLQSTIAKIGDTSHCQHKTTITSGRQSWREITNT